MRADRAGRMCWVSAFYEREVCEHMKNGEIATSAAQRRVLLDMEARSLRTDAYNLAESIEIPGPLRIDEFIASLRHVAAESAALRLRCRVGDAERAWTPEREPGFDVPVLDFSSCEQGTERALAWMRSEMRKPFDLAGQAPLFRYALLRIEAERHFWFAMYHHFAVDAYGMWLLAHRVTDAYSMVLQGESPLRMSDGAQYEEFLQREERYELSDEWREDQLYWMGIRAAIESRDVISGGVRRRAREEGVVRRCRANLSNELLRSCDVLERRYELVADSLLVAAVCIQACRFQGKRRAVLGMAVHGRRERSDRSLAAMCAKILPLSIELQETASYLDVARELRGKFREAAAHHRLLGSRVETESIGIDEETMAVTINWIRFKRKLLVTGFATRSEYLSPGPVEGIEILLDHREGNEPKIDFYANPERYGDDELGRFRDGFQAVVQAIVENPCGQVSEMVPLSQRERDELLLQWNRTSRKVRRACVQELFAQQARRTPQAVAVTCEGEQLSYAQLDECAERLARRLVSLGVGPEVIVGLCVERGVQMVVGLLGILKAGGAYLPLDPSYPRERLQFMLQDAGAAVL